MKILIATGMYPPEIGGPATFTKTVLPELILRGHEVRVITYGKKQKSAEGVRFVSRRWPRGFRHAIYFLKMIPMSLWSEKILVLDPVSVGAPARFASRLTGIKYIVRIVGDYAWEQGIQRFGVKELLDEFLKKKYGFFAERLRRVQTKTAQGSEKVIVPSEYLKSVVEAWGVESEKITVVHNSVHQEYNVSREDARKDLGLSGTVLVSAGRLVPWKGFAMLISLMPDLRKKSDMRLVIIGDGPDQKKLEELRDRLKLSQWVTFTGVVSKEVLGQYMVAADAFLLNTGYEGFSHQILEAMLAGVPVITTDSGGNKEITKDGKNALVLPYNDKEEWVKGIEELVNNQELQDRLKKEASKYREVYTVDLMISGIEKLLTP